MDRSVGRSRPPCYPNSEQAACKPWVVHANSEGLPQREEAGLRWNSSLCRGGGMGSCRTARSQRDPSTVSPVRTNVHWGQTFVIYAIFRRFPRNRERVARIRLSATIFAVLTWLMLTSAVACQWASLTDEPAAGPAPVSEAKAKVESSRGGRPQEVSTRRHGIRVDVSCCRRSSLAPPGYGSTCRVLLGRDGAVSTRGSPKSTDPQASFFNIRNQPDVIGGHSGKVVRSKN